MHPPSSASQRITTLALVLMLATVWLLMRGYHGLTGDAQLYAFQALSRIHPQFTTDLYLENTSQDQFTIFSPLYAWFIGVLGLENSARLLTLLFSFWVLAAAWSLARAISSSAAAWLGVAFLLIAPSIYGGSDVFHFSETFLTARLAAEALVVTALACQVRGMPRVGWVLTIGALLVHPLIALPGLLLLLCLRTTYRVNVAAAIAGVLFVAAIALTSTVLRRAHTFNIMDPAWLAVVQERSQFLFLQLWSFHDWDVNTRPFIYLGMSAIVVTDERIRKLCVAAALVGGVGLLVAMIGSLIGPVAILVQGQAWRWTWTAAFISVLLLPATVLKVWQDDRCGPLCSLLLIAGWTWTAVDGTACASIALSLWAVRARISTRAAPYIRWAATALGIVMVSWVAVKSWTIVSPSIIHAGGASSGATQLREVFDMRLPAAIFVGLVGWFTRSSSTIWIPALLSLILVLLSIFLLPAAFKQSRTFASAADIDEFSIWRNTIPPTATVLIAPARDVGAFVWFTLDRPNYLAVDQSAGVVFSRATALEVARRSDVLRPLMDPDWKILSGLRAASAAGQQPLEPATRPLTAASLTRVCADPQLGFVISPENVGFEPLRHESAGAWKDWNLYDCRKVRSTAVAT